MNGNKNKILSSFLTASIAIIAVFSTGCVSNDYNDKVASMTGFTADEVSFSQKSNFHQITLDAAGGEVLEEADGSKVVKFDTVNYDQFNNLWSTAVRLKGYRRVINKLDETPPVAIPDFDD